MRKYQCKNLTQQFKYKIRIVNVYFNKKNNNSDDNNNKALCTSTFNFKQMLSVLNIGLIRLSGHISEILIEMSKFLSYKEFQNLGRVFFPSLSLSVLGTKVYFTRCTS